MLPIPNNKMLTRQNFVLYIIFILILLQTIMIMQQQQQQTNNFTYNLVFVINVILLFFIVLQYIALIKIDQKIFKLHAHYKNNTHHIICT